jgi:hypothetical protein
MDVYLLGIQLFPFHCVYITQGFHHILLDVCKYLMMQSSLWQMVRTSTSEDSIIGIPEGSVGCGHGQVPRGGAPPPPPHPPVSLEQLLATQNDLMRRLVFADATNPLEADSWLRTIESMFGLLHCTEYQKTMYATQQLRGSAGAWWASYITTLPVDQQVPWGEFRTTFRAHHLSAGLVHIKLKEFVDLEQGNYSVFDYTRHFNTLAQYESCHIDTDEKKANLYRAGLAIHLQERLI